MRLLTLLTAILLLNGCAVYTSLAVHSTAYDRPEIELENPIFVLGGSVDLNYVDGYCEHHSGVFKTEAGGGYNLCGIKYYWTD